MADIGRPVKVVLRPVHEPMIIDRTTLVVFEGIWFEIVVAWMVQVSAGAVDFWQLLLAGHFIKNYYCYRALTQMNGIHN